jgi:hypothetical protein
MGDGSYFLAHKLAHPPRNELANCAALAFLEHFYLAVLARSRYLIAQW